MAGRNAGKAAGTKQTKQVTPKAVTQSVIDIPQQAAVSPTPSTTLEASLLWMVGTAADEISPWGVRPKIRDQELRNFYPTESLFSSALGVVTARNTGFKWTLEGPPRVAAEAHRILEEANMGEGWANFIAKISVDLYTQDHGAFIEVVRDGDSPESPLVGINHLDAGRCWHTGDPQKPVIYQDRKGVFHLLDWFNVVTLAEMPTPIERLYGLQVCALSRLLLAAQILKNIAIYKQEKTGGRHTRAIHLIAGMTTAQIEDALAQATGQADAKGLMRFMGPLIVGSVDPKAVIDIKSLELTTLPDGFNEEVTFKHYVAQIAMALRTDYQEFAPLPGGSLGTSAQSEVLHQKSRGKGAAVFMKIVAEAFNFKILPKVVEFQFEEQDPEADEQQARIRKIRAEERSVRLLSKEITEAEARQLAVDAGDLPEELFEAAGGLDMTPQRKLPSTEKPEVEEGHIEEELEPVEGESEVSSLVPFGEAEAEAAVGSKARAGPFEDERIRAERRLRLAVEKAFTKIFANVKKRLKREARKELAEKARSGVPDDEAFWSVQKEEFMAALGDQPQELIQQGVEQASQLGLAVGFDVVNEQVLDLSAQYTDDWWNQLSGTTRKGMRRAIRTHIEAGTPLRTLEKDLEPLFGKRRAKLIASTETTRLYTEGNRVAFQDSSVDQVEWQTVKDAVVDPDCEALQGQRWPLGQETVSPPLHPGCRCWLAPVVCTGESELGSKQETCEVLLDRADQPPAEEIPGYEQEMGGRVKGLLSPSKRKRIRADLDSRFGKDAGYKRMRGTAKRWSRHGDAEMRAASRRILTGQPCAEPACADAEFLMRAVSRSPIQGKPVYRGMHFGSQQTTVADLQEAWRVGRVVDTQLSSATYDRQIATRMFGATKTPGYNGVVMKFEDAQGLPISVFSVQAGEEELLIGGRFEVVAQSVVRKARGEGTVHITLRQVASLP